MGILILSEGVDDREGRHVRPPIQVESPGVPSIESTGDQFYAEDQFESYRHLGRDIAYEVFGPLASEPTLVTAAVKLHASQLGA